jgi:hypothetical protein
MALSKIIKIGNGVTNQFAVSFELGYINQDDITAQVGGEVDGLGAPLYRTITFLTPELLQISGAVPGNGVPVEFVRTVPSDLLLVNYEDGDIVNDENMNTAQKQAMMLIHQLLDGRFEKFDSGFDMGGFVITGLGAPVNSLDAVRKDYVDALIGGTETARLDAEQSASAAATSAVSAASSVVLAENAVLNTEILRDATQDIHDLTLNLYDSFDDRYLGSKSSPPTLDNDGDTLTVGALYYRTTAPIGMYVWSGVAWNIVSGGALMSANNLSDLTSVATAKSNLGLSEPDSNDVAYARRNTAWFDILPAGAVWYFARSTAPTGWLESSGQAVSLSTYPRLIDIYCGNGNNAAASWGYRCTNPASPTSTRSTSGAYIVLPRVNGEFIRGWDNGAGIDTGRSLWAYQGHALQDHTHLTPNFTPTGSFAQTASSVAITPGGSGIATGNVVGAAVASETRGRNVALLGCIKT